MPLYVLDTDMLSLLQRGSHSVATRVSERGPGELAITVITVEEQLSGWFALLRRTSAATELAKIYQRLADTVHLLFHLSMRTLSRNTRRYEGSN